MSHEIPTLHVIDYEGTTIHIIIGFSLVGDNDIKAATLQLTNHPYKAKCLQNVLIYSVCGLAQF